MKNGLDKWQEENGWYVEGFQAAIKEAWDAAQKAMLDEFVEFINENSEYPETMLYRLKQKYGGKNEK